MMPSFYLITRTLDSLSYNYINTEIFGDVEIRSAIHDFDVEKTVLKKAEGSSFSRGLNVSDYDFSNRMSVIVEAKDEIEAIRLANDKFVTVLDLKANELDLANINLSKVGVVRDLSTGSIKSFLILGIFKSSVFIRNVSDIQRWNTINFMLEKDGSLKISDELSSRYIKSIHWSHHASDEENKQLKVIFNYFCLEALFKENENDNITGMVRCFLGFPGGKYFKDVDRNIIDELNKSDEYLSLAKDVPKHLDDIRKFRNDSVHAGFRSIDISNEKLKLYDDLLNLAKFRCLNAVQLSIINEGVKDLPEFKNKAGFIFNKTARVDDILGTVVFSLQNGYDHDIIIID
ncbi:hypothetical protein [Pectobacterium versatile]|uniref:hypothetical protein n=1 Tax=Pectobacterium versatile TaxID=2488639 RepID=UPI002B23FEB5|nr:hypothetical protein [Pectobacterium versatile]